MTSLRPRIEHLQSRSTWASVWAGLLFLFLPVSLLQSTCGDRHEGENASMLENVHILPQMASATRLLVSSDGRFAVAELYGRWVRDQFEENSVRDEIPPVYKVLDIRADRVLAAGSGWAMTLPDRDGAMLYLEEYPEEYRYQVRTTGDPLRACPLEPPPGFWQVKTTLPCANRSQALVVLWSFMPGFVSTEPERTERLWLAVIDVATLRVIQTRALELTMLHTEASFARGIFMDPVRPVLYTIELPNSASPTKGSEDWYLQAIDTTTLQTLWRTALPPYSSSDGERKARPFHIMLGAATGDGSTVCVLAGMRIRESVYVDALYALNAVDGTLARSIDRFSLGRILYDEVFQMSSLQAKSVGLVHWDKIGVGYGTFSGISRIDLNGDPKKSPSSILLEINKRSLGRQLAVFEDLYPSAVALDSNGAVYLAPYGDDWAWIRRVAAVPNFDVGRGRERPEVRGRVTMPQSWHQKDRPRVQAYDQWKKQNAEAR